MWNAIAIHPIFECRKHCPFCYAQGNPEAEKPVSFFKEVLKNSRAIPQWIFACNWAGPEAWDKIVELIHCAWKCRHPYSLTSNYENLSGEHLPVFKRAEYTAVSLDDYKVSVHLFDDFLRTLERSRAAGVSLRVIVTLTASMLMKIVYGNILQALFPLVERVHLNLPKSPDALWVEASLIEVFLRYYHQKLSDREFFGKVELDPCLKAQLPVWREVVDASCAYQSMLTIMPDGLLKICPYTRAGFLLHKPSEMKNIIQQSESLQQKITPRCFLPLLAMPAKEVASCA